MRLSRRFSPNPVFVMSLVVLLLASFGCANLDSSADLVGSTDIEALAPDVENGTSEEASTGGAPALLDIESQPAGTILLTAVGTEAEAASEFAVALAANNISGEFIVSPRADQGYDLVLVAAGPGDDDEGLDIPMDTAALGEAPPPSTTYYHDYVSASGTGSYTTSVVAGDDQGLSWCCASGKTSHMTGTASWASTASFVSYTVTEYWYGVGMSFSIPAGFTGTFGTTYGWFQMAGSKSGSSSNVSWCVTGPYGTAFTSKTITAALTVKSSGGTTYLLSKSAKSYFVYDWTSTTDAC